MGRVSEAPRSTSLPPPGLRNWRGALWERDTDGEGHCGRGALMERGIVGEAYRGCGLTWRDSAWWPRRTEGYHQTPCSLSAPTLQLHVSTSHWLKRTGSRRTREPLMWSTKAKLLEDRVGQKEWRVGQEEPMEEIQHGNFHVTYYEHYEHTVYTAIHVACTQLVTFSEILGSRHFTDK